MDRKSMKDRFDDVMSAITFAEAGEFEKARDILRGRDRVLLALSDLAFDRNALKYSLSIARRVNAGIAIVYLTKTGAYRGEIDEFSRKASQEGIPCSLTTVEGCMKKAILDYTEKRREILFVVVGSTPELDVDCRAGEKSLSDAWKRLQCPLVVVTKEQLPSQA